MTGELITLGVFAAFGYMFYSIPGLRKSAKVGATWAGKGLILFVAAYAVVTGPLGLPRGAAGVTAAATVTAAVALAYGLLAAHRRGLLRAALGKQPATAD
jgi:hypothetical protein